MILLISTLKARNNLSNLMEAVGENISTPSMFCKSPLAHNLDFNLSSPPEEFIFALNMNNSGMICSPGNGWPSRLKVCSVMVFSSLLVASIHWALIFGSLIYKNCFIDLGSGM